METVNELIFWQGIIFFFLLVAMKVFLFWIGYLITKLGADLLRDGIRGEFKFKTELRGVRADLASASPGLFFALLGTFLIGYAVFVDKPVDTSFLASRVIESPEIEVPGELP